MSIKGERELVENLHRLSMAVQGEVPPEVVEQRIREARIEAEWNSKTNGLLAVVTGPAHRYHGRVGQVKWATHDFFVGSEEGIRVGSKRIVAAGVWKFCLCVSIDSNLVYVQEGAFLAIEKERMAEYSIEVVDGEGRKGLLLGWFREEGRGRGGFYQARFGQEIIEKDDWLMMQEPTWKFHLPPEGLEELQTKKSFDVM